MATLKDYALTTVADVKESLGIASSNHQYDNLIIRKINQATAMIESYCGRHFKQATYTDELYNGSNIDQLVLKQRPLIIAADTPLTIKGRYTPLNEADLETIDSELYFADAESAVIGLNFRLSGHWGRYAVTYTAGYATIPDDLAEAAASLAAYLVGNADSSLIGVTKKKEGQREVNYSNNNVGTVSFDTIAANLGIDGILNSYSNTPLFADK